MSKPKIAFVSDAIFPYNKGGKETRLHEITTRLLKQGWEVHIYCMKWWEGDSNKIEEGIFLHGISPYYPLYSGSRRSMKQGILFGVHCLKLMKEDFDVIDVDQMPYFPLFSARIVCWIKRKKMIVSWHEVWGMDYWREYLGFVKGTIAGAIELVAAQTPDVVAAVSQLTALKLQNDLKYKKELVIVNNGFDLNEVIKSKPSKLKSDVIFVGRLLTHKNVDVLIKAIALLVKKFPKLNAFIVGEGPEKEQLITLSSKLNLGKNITFLPFQKSKNDIYGLMKSSKVFVLPSTREGFGLVVLEANGAGLPVITINHPDNAAKDLISEKNGQIVDLSKEAIADSIEKYLNDSTKKSFHSDHSWEKTVQQLSKIYKTSLL